MQDISDCLSLEAQNVAEARLAAKRAARAEAREIRMKELERQQKEVEERSDKDFGEKDSLAEVEEKYKRSMVTNAQLDNEKTSLQYQVDTLREVLLELEEELAESRRQYEDKHKECERQKHDQNVLRFQLAEMKEALEQRESLLTKHGIALDSVGTPNGDTSVEPHVNADGRPDPPIRATSMGPSEEAVEKKETMSVVGEIPPAKTEQDKQEVLMTAPTETPLNTEVGDKMKKQNHQETASNSVDDVDTGGTLSVCQTNLEHQGKGLPLGSESTSNACEITVGECAPENLPKEVLEQSSSEGHREAAIDQRVTSSVESEVFQDALDIVVHTPCVTNPFSEEHTVFVDDFQSEDHNISQQDFNKEEDKCEVQHTSIESNNDPNIAALGISECSDIITILTDDMTDLHTGTKDVHETSSPDGSSQADSEESITDKLKTTAVEHKVCEENIMPEEQSVSAESALQCGESDSEKTDSDTNDTSSEKESVSAETAIETDIHDVVEEKKTDLTHEQSPQDIQLTKEEKPLIDSENNINLGAVPEPCMLSNMQITVENKVLIESEVLEVNIRHLDQHEDTKDAGSLTTDLESLENGKINIVFLEASGTELSDKGEQDEFSDNLVYDNNETINEKSNTVFREAPNIELLDEGKPGNVSDHPVCDESENMDEKTNLAFPDVLGTELLDEGKPGNISDNLVYDNSEKTSEKMNTVFLDAPGTELLNELKQDEISAHPVCDKNENTNENIPFVLEIPKVTLPSETLSSEGDSTPEGEESDDDHDEDVAVRSEKYTGESLALGSSVDQTSTDDIRMEDGSDKAARKGKGKNKEDCVVA